MSLIADSLALGTEGLISSTGLLADPLLLSTAGLFSLAEADVIPPSFITMNVIYPGHNVECKISNGSFPLTKMSVIIPTHHPE
ncbi:MAG: hypothetical protein AAGA83_00300 [Cyanobacteria bacterium P01_F01_bin.116]